MSEPDFDSILMRGWHAGLQAAMNSLPAVLTGTELGGDERLSARAAGAAGAVEAMRVELAKLSQKPVSFVMGFAGVEGEPHEQHRPPVPLRLVMRDMVRVIDTLNRDRSFELAEAAQTALGWMSTLDGKLSAHGLDDWWITPPEQWDDGWKPTDELPVWRR